MSIVVFHKLPTEQYNIYKDEKNTIMKSTVAECLMAQYEIMGWKRDTTWDNAIVYVKEDEFNV